MQSAARVDQLLRSAFPGPPGASFYDDFPVWDPRFAAVTGARLFTAPEEGLPVAMAFARQARLKLAGAAAVPVGIIGGVTTLESHRGRGLASQVVESACEWLREGGAELALLWGSETGLYERLGFKPAGRQVRTALARFRGLPESREIVHEGWNPALFDCLRSKGVGLELGEADRAWIEAHRNVRWLWTGPREAPTAYAAIGRGIDLSGIVHEWGGDRPALMQILRAISLRQPQAELLGSPELFAELSLRATSPVEPVALARPLTGKEVPASLWIWGLDSA